MDHLLGQVATIDYCSGPTNSSHVFVNSNFVGTTSFNVDLSLSTLSAISLGLVALLVLADERIQAHPNLLIAYNCLLDAFNYANFSSRYVACGYGLDPYLDNVFYTTV
jgi:hypothetical protein